MANTPGRNDPCPCGSGSGSGSGKKYKHCCLAAADRQARAQSAGHAGAVARALAWLTQRHRKAVQAAMDQVMHRLIDEATLENFNGLDDTVLEGVHLNLTEWLLAEGSLLIHGKDQRTSDYVLGHKGPLLTVHQRNWLQ